ncbi:MAG TPA: hypothetical protein VGJ64_00395 [Gemmatimonadaceae bacterium]
MTTLPDERLKRLSSLNDPLLGSLFDAKDEAERNFALERIVVTEARPLIRRVLAGISVPTLRPEDVEDITATINLRLVQRLQSAAVLEDAAVTSFAGFVATLTFRAFYQMLRRLSPARTHLKDRLRYVLTHDRRLALWFTRAGTVAGRAEWTGRNPVRGSCPSKSNATLAMLDRASPADAVAAIFDRVGSPLLFADLIALITEFWDVHDRTTESFDDVVDLQAGPLPRIESRQYLTMIWEEIRALPVAQRVALLLNLRDGEKTDALAVLVLVGISTIDQIAAALEMPAERLADLWSSLPLDDLTIGSMLGVTRQQVINLRKTGRERLTRRMKTREGMRVSRCDI